MEQRNKPMTPAHFRRFLVINNANAYRPHVGKDFLDGLTPDEFAEREVEAMTEQQLNGHAFVRNIKLTENPADFFEKKKGDENTMSVWELVDGQREVVIFEDPEAGYQVGEFIEDEREVQDFIDHGQFEDLAEAMRAGFNVGYY